MLVLHGFTGSPQSLRSLAEALAVAGHTVELPLWPGHGTAVEDLVPSRWKDWESAAERAYETLAERCSVVALAALSMGGTLACHLAARYAEIRGLALVNPLIDTPPGIRDILNELLEGGTDVAPGVGSDIAKADVEELAYSGTPVAAALSVFDGAAEVARDLSRIKCPVLVLTSRQDHVVPTESSDVLASGVSGPVERVWLERSYHVATLDYDAEEIVSRVVGFIGEVLAGERSDSA